MSQYVVWYDSSETGAPVLNNAAGSLLAVIDACGITGFNTRAITITVTDGVATATSNGHGYSGIYSKDIEVAGATPAGLNGRKALTYVDTNTFRFDATGIADGAATGSITAKRSPFGLVKQYAGTNKAIYKRTDAAASSMMMRVLDTAAAPATGTDARVLMIETATDVDTYTGAAPTAVQVTDSNGQYWNKGSNSATAKQWAMIGTAKGFFLVTPNGAIVLPQAGTTNSASLMAFFDFPSFKAGDAYNTALCGPVSSASGNSAIVQLSRSNNFSAPNDATLVIARAHSQVGGAVRGNCTGIATGVSGDSSWPYFPSPIDNGLFICPSVFITEDLLASGYPPRGTVPGLCQVLARAPFAHYQIVDSVNALPGRKLLALNHGQNGAGGVIAVDLTGPWGA